MAQQRYRMDVQGMTCDDCDRHVADALRQAGAGNAEASYRRGEATFSLGDGLEEGKLAAAVKDAGYALGPIESLPGPETVAQAGTIPQRGAGVDYDLAILGSGSAAFAAAIRARDLGARVVMIERDTLGGTCVNIGCVPSKALLQAAEAYYQAGHHQFAGIETEATGVDLAALVEQKDGLVATMRKEKYANLVEVYDWEMVRGEARFVDRETVEVDGRPIRATHYLIATGAVPTAPPIPGLEQVGYLTSTTALELQDLPKSVAVIGANAVGLELADLFYHLGAQVKLFEAEPRIAPFEEPEISDVLAALLRKRRVQVVTGAQITRVERAGERRRLYVGPAGSETGHTVDAIIVATGRRPDTAGLNPAAAGIETGDRGAVAVDEYLRTANPRMWAAGDVTGGPQFVYVAAYQGTVAADNMFSDSPRAGDLSALPKVTFSHPQIASVGLTEEQAKAEGNSVKTAVLELKHVPRAIVNHETEGVIKLVANADSDRLLGAHILAENAGEVIHAATLAVKFNLTVGDLTGSFAPYLTMAEGLKLAAQTFGKDVSRLSCCAA